MKELNLQNRFDIVFDGCSYEFITPENVSYQIIFIDYSGIIEVNSPVYMLTIERTIPKGCTNKFDDKIQNSILYTINRFFSENDNAIIAIYDITDGKHNARKRLFNRWYNEYNNIGLVKMESEVSIGSTKTTATLFYISSNDNKDEIIKAFNRIVGDNFYC